MNPRRHLLARGYAATVIVLRHVIPLAWIAAVVLATISLPDLASAPTAPLEDLAAKNGAASKAAAESTKIFGFPLSTQTAVVQRNPNGLSQAAQQRAVAGARTVLTHSDPALSDISAAVPISNGARDVPAGERGTTAVTYLLFPPQLSLESTTQTAHTYANKELGGPRGNVVGVTGAAPARLAQFDEIEHSLPIIEAASILLIFVVVAIAFRSLGAPLVALATAGVTFLLAIRILPWAGEQANVTVPKEVQPIIVVLLLGLVTDYTIFFLSGMRRRLRLGEERIPAARASVVEVAPIVFTAGLIVAAGTAALVAGKLDFFRAFGPGLALTTVISMVVAITLVPALIAIFGGRLFGRKVREEGERAAREARAEQGRVVEDRPKPGAEVADEPGALTRRGPLASVLLRVTRPVTAMRRAPDLAREHGTAPWRLFVARIAASPPVALVIAVLAIGALGFAASNVANMKLGLTFIASLPSHDEVRVTSDAAQKGFAPGILAPTEVDLAQAGVGAKRPQLDRLQALIAREPGVAAVLGPRQQVPGAPPVTVARDGNAGRHRLVLDKEPLGAPAVDRFRALRDDMPALVQRAGLGPGVTLSFGGETALADDTITRVLDDLKRVAVVAIVVNVLLLVVFMRAFVAPMYLVASSVLGLLASLGLTTFLFQQVLGNDDLTYYVPFAAAVLLVALGSDYNVFVAGRIWEEARRYRLREAIAVAMPAAARAVTAAGLALAASFALLAIVPLRSFREFAFVMTAGILIDTFVVRSLLVPALTSLFGEVAWWPGRRMKPGETSDLVERVAARAGVGPAEAERATKAALCTLAERIAKKETRTLASQLRGALSDHVRRAARRPERFDLDEFVRRMGEREGVPDDVARVHARAVLTTLEDATVDRLAYVRAQLSEDYEPLFHGGADGALAATATDRSAPRD